ncbi:LacI family DNA-binding transcriptional regulator [Pedobacter petrophilus]|uniref:LacI family DNA-binding transcriptional regulator n=1 Tax=Pedobacter petrophilus TaxID=1908241 RepID=A0A7K0FZW3_9SPHI|nr:LacI family DNA-binding transcriptional regulator [Pedobacter petrophilus]MRX76991.1 LacI family DNA-binding transcriptional regulator [Pedobacter petrophilus]
MVNKISMKDIAIKCGTSITTVSFVINGRANEKKISETMTAKVKKVITELGYQPHSMAQGLRTGKSKTIGFLVDDISEPFFSGIAKYLDEKATASGYKILFCCTGNDPKKASELISMLNDRSVDGYIIALAEGVEQEISKLLEKNIPMVLFDRYLLDLNTDYVIVNNIDSTYAATIHLIKNGYSRIAFVGPQTTQQQMIDRCTGYQRAIKDYGMVERVIYLSSPIEHGGGFWDIIKGNDKPDAFLFAANYITMQALRLLISIDPKLLEQFAMISFDDIEILQFLPVPITAIVQPLEEIAVGIMDILLTRLGESTQEAKIHKIISTKMIVRKSSVNRNVVRA